MNQCQRNIIRTDSVLRFSQGLVSSPESWRLTWSSMYITCNRWSIVRSDYKWWSLTIQLYDWMIWWSVIIVLQLVLFALGRPSLFIGLYFWPPHGQVLCSYSWSTSSVTSSSLSRTCRFPYQNFVISLWFFGSIKHCLFVVSRFFEHVQCYC